MSLAGRPLRWYEILRLENTRVLGKTIKGLGLPRHSFGVLLEMVESIFPILAGNASICSTTATFGQVGSQKVHPFQKSQF